MSKLVLTASIAIGALVALATALPAAAASSTATAKDKASKLKAAHTKDRFKVERFTFAKAHYLEILPQGQGKLELDAKSPSGLVYYQENFNPDTGHYVLSKEDIGEVPGVDMVEYPIMSVTQDMNRPQILSFRVTSLVDGIFDWNLRKGGGHTYRLIFPNAQAATYVREMLVQKDHINLVAGVDSVDTSVMDDVEHEGQKEIRSWDIRTQGMTLVDRGSAEFTPLSKILERHAEEVAYEKRVHDRTDEDLKVLRSIASASATRTKARHHAKAHAKGNGKRLAVKPVSAAKEPEES